MSIILRHLKLYFWALKIKNIHHVRHWDFSFQKKSTQTWFYTIIYVLILLNGFVCTYHRKVLTIYLKRKKSHQCVYHDSKVFSWISAKTFFILKLWLVDRTFQKLASVFLVSHLTFSTHVLYLTFKHSTWAH